MRSIAERTRIESALTLRWQASALDCLQEAAEVFLVDVFSNVAMAAAHANHVTVKLVDLHLEATEAFLVDFFSHAALGTAAGLAVYVTRTRRPE
ncbi:unnamed protein product [Mesocestoides corti]|uniref:Core Histone H2A/H2B/H3 domain-containing protein n=1 Tax=Mesocestoides corti TaxID=53468 RepID=A0A0R3UCG9_MESCO|nr:unnamed protein product [Mesocestoides corti]